MRNRWIAAALTCAALGCSDNNTSTPGGDSGTDTGSGTGTDAGTGGGDGGLTPCLIDAGPHFVIDPADGKCKLDGTTTHIGVACTNATVAVCGTDQNAACLTPDVDNYPGGYCNVDPCTEQPGHLCPIGASCVSLNGENPQCFKNCNSNADCRASEGYICLDMTKDAFDGGLWTSGASHKVCSKPLLQCATDMQCPMALPHCVVAQDGGAAPDSGTGGVSDAGGPVEASSPDAVAGDTGTADSGGGANPGDAGLTDSGDDGSGGPGPSMICAK
jgi:hypothetical protein